MVVFVNQAGNQRYNGTDPEYDQVDYVGSLLDYTFTQNQNGTVTATHTELGTDTLSSIEGFWFSGEEAWYSIEDAIALTTANTNPQPDNNPDNDAVNTGTIDDRGFIVGDTGNDRLTGGNQNDIFYGGRGDDVIDGNGGGYNQVEYDGDLNEYTFTQNANGSVTVTHATWGTDTLTDIDGLWFYREAAWYSVDDAIRLSDGAPEFRLDADGVLNGTTGDDRMIGDAGDDFYYGGTGNDFYNGNEGYNQVNFGGALSEYTITQNDNGSYTFDHPVWGTDTLTNIDGLWLGGEAQWYAVDDGLLA